MQSLNTLFDYELQAMLNRADLSLEHLPLFTEFLPNTFKRFHEDRLPSALAFLETIADACNHEVDLRFEPRLSFDGNLIDLLQLAYAQSWKAYKKADGHTRFIGPNGRTKAVVLEKGSNVIEIYLTPHGRRVIDEFRKNGSNGVNFEVELLD